MSRTLILLDAGPLGLISNPKQSGIALQCNEWLRGLLLNNVRVLVPEITDYEVRRELLRANKVQGIQRLNRVKTELGYLPINTDIMLQAAQLWATARNQGQPTADDKALDADVILAATAFTISAQGNSTVIATTNVKHIGRFTIAKNWQDISPEAM
jgi:predicted nucleic acid-binding protein